MHFWHAPYYIRRVRADIKDPLTKFLTDIGVSAEPDVMAPQNTVVFSYPIKAPDGAICREDRSAIEHLELWRTYKRYWTEHNPSITVSVRDHEWIDVAAWIYANWEDVGGISFLPYDGGSYKQAPYETISKEQYEELIASQPKTIDWSMLSLYETFDTTTGSQELSCTAGACDVLDIAAESIQEDA
jgi:ribonucleoside-diphosphate reductase alpha chain